MNLSPDLMARIVRMLPRSAFSQTVGWLSERSIPRPLRPLILGAVARALGIDLADAEHRLREYDSTLALFCRALRPGVRDLPADPKLVVSPVDGRLVEVGRVDAERRFSIKGQRYSVGEMLGGDEEWVARFDGGQFMLFYLSPKDYHRMHSPVAGRVLAYRWFTGELWPVMENLVALLPQVYSHNERVVTYLDSDFGVVAFVKVAALGVGNITLSYLGEGAGDRRAPRKRPAERRFVPARAPAVARGGELASFGLGSTVVLLFERGAVAVDPAIARPGALPAPVRMGQPIAYGRSQAEEKKVAS